MMEEADLRGPDLGRSEAEEASRAPFSLINFNKHAGLFFLFLRALREVSGCAHSDLKAFDAGPWGASRRDASMKRVDR